ncbi:hypothetical protein [Citrobacter gillenii]|uniref:hypothetical protein n=1 Tax=Citrobacter gillenii TaxID=67828 RepID=UPI0022E0E01D|nr:hypothetical protein [Citrobacter gillenii]
MSYTLYPPGATVSGDTRTENWFNSPEVGNTGSGTAGLDLGSSGPETVSIIADALVVSGNSITLVDVSSSGDEEIPPSWTVGTVITVLAPNSYTVVSSGGYSVIYGGVVPTRIDDFTISVPYSTALEPELWAMNDAYIEPPRLLFCSSVRVPYDALVGEITPGNDGISQVTAIQYHPGKYAYDDATYPGDSA